MFNGLIIMLGMVICSSIFGYYAFMAWFRPESFRKKVIERNINYDLQWPLSNMAKQWMRGRSYIWYVRTVLLLGFLISSAIFLLGVWGYMNHFLE